MGPDPAYEITRNCWEICFEIDFQKHCFQHWQAMPLVWPSPPLPTTTPMMLNQIQQFHTRCIKGLGASNMLQARNCNVINPAFIKSKTCKYSCKPSRQTNLVFYEKVYLILQIAMIKKKMWESIITRKLLPYPVTMWWLIIMLKHPPYPTHHSNKQLNSVF